MRLLIGLYALLALLLAGMAGILLAMTLIDALEGAQAAGGASKQRPDSQIVEVLVIYLFVALLPGGAALGLCRVLALSDPHSSEGSRAVRATPTPD
jgi:hypothetical protein